MLSNFTIETKGATALAHYFGKADHFLNGEIWTAEGTYDTKLTRTNNDNWLITEHKFNFEKQSGSTSPTRISITKNGKAGSSRTKQESSRQLLCCT